MFVLVQILVQVGGDRKWRTSRTTLRTPTPLVIRDCFLVYCARTWKISFPHTFKCLKRKSQMNSCMETCVALSIFCLNIALLCSPLNAFETWADQQELSKEARYKSAFSTRRRVSLLESSMLLINLMEARNQKNCKGSWPHSLSTAQFVVLFFTPRMRLKEHRCLFCKWLPNSLPSLRYTVPHTWLAYIPAEIPYTLDNQSIAWGLLFKLWLLANSEILLCAAM